MFKPLGVSEITMCVFDVAWLHLPGEPKLYAEFISELVSVASEHAGGCVVGASGDVEEARVALFFTNADQARQFNDNWRTVARRVHSELLAAWRAFDSSDLPF